MTETIDGGVLADVVSRLRDITSLVEISAITGTSNLIRWEDLRNEVNDTFDLILGDYIEDSFEDDGSLDSDEGFVYDDEA